MDIISLIGSSAACCSVVSFTPQAAKIIQTGKTRDISTGMYVFTVMAFALWCIYGVRLNHWSLVVSNAICFVFSAFILTMKLLPQKKAKSRARGKKAIR